MDHEDAFRLLCRLMLGTAQSLLDEHDDLTPFGVTVHGADLVPRPIYPADNAHDVTFDDLLDFVLLELRTRGLSGDMVAAAVATRLDRVDQPGIALAVQIATPDGDAAFLSPCHKSSDGWTLTEADPMTNPLFPEGLWWPRDAL